jgi:hypothetical protein
MEKIKENLEEIYRKLKRNNIQNILLVNDLIEVYNNYGIINLYYKKDNLILKIKNIIYSDEFLKLYDVINNILEIEKIKLEFDIMNDITDLTNIINTTCFYTSKLNILIYSTIEETEMDLINTSYKLKKITIISNKNIKIINNLNSIKIENIILNYNSI